MRRQSLFTGLAIAAFFIARSAVAADAPPSIAELKQLLTEAKYPAALAGASRLISLSGTAGQAVDKAAAYAIKGEAHLRLKAYPAAADDFANAAKLATDTQVVAEDKANELLARRTHAGTYTPKQPGADGKPIAPIDVTDDAQRRAAFEALFDDEFAADAPKLKAAKTATSIPQLLAAADTTLTLRSLEVAATGKAEKVKPELAALSDHAHDLIDTTIQSDSKRIDDISQAANQSSAAGQTNGTGRTAGGRGYSAGGGGGAARPSRKVGLTQQNQSELKDMIAVTQKVAPVAQAFAKATVDDGGTAGTWDTLTADATRIGQKANDVLTADYSGRPTGGNQPPR